MRGMGWKEEGMIDFGMANLDAERIASGGGGEGEGPANLRLIPFACTSYVVFFPSVRQNLQNLHPPPPNPPILPAFSTPPPPPSPRPPPTAQSLRRLPQPPNPNQFRARIPRSFSSTIKQQSLQPQNARRSGGRGELVEDTNDRRRGTNSGHSRKKRWNKRSNANKDDKQFSGRKRRREQEQDKDLYI
ncbi:hypothetical protein niasHT_020543 [Heterodera trifolii]|uniref:Uncharacterized protein n=1 Tax=Heterodera trifolii TaxID=157864 RepID=A0ABD2J9I8_9BILA